MRSNSAVRQANIAPRGNAMEHTHDSMEWLWVHERRRRLHGRLVLVAKWLVTCTVILAGAHYLATWLL